MAPPAAPKDNFRNKVLLIVVLLALGFAGVAGRLLWLQVVTSGELAARAAKQQREVVELPPRRGAMYDRNGRELAVSIDAYSLYGVPANVKDPSAVAGVLAPAIGAQRAVLKEKLTGDKKFVWLARKVAPGVPERVDAAGLGNEIGWLTDCRRYYPKKMLASHVLGFTGTDNEGLEGLEARYEKIIGGVSGKAVTQKDGSGKELLAVEEGINSPKPGCDIVLTIDENIQHIAERELDKIMELYSPVSATAIVMDPATGEILAMASRPGFNPNDWQGTDPKTWRNRAVTDLYEPGSTFKIITAAAALEEGVVTPGERIDCGEGWIEVGGRKIHSAHGEGGVLTFREVIQKSNNVGTIKAAMKLGPQKLHGYAKAFGIGEKTGVDLPGEAGGLLRDPKNWSGVSIGSVSIGQEVNVTALQMISALNVVANGGEWVAPYVVSAVRTEDGRQTGRERLKPRRVLSKKTAEKLSEILGNVVEEGGTAVLARIRGYQVAGKTGTAQKFDRAAGRYSSDKYVSSFMGYVPAESPKLSAIIVVDEPKGQHYGGVVAGPAFKKIAEQTLMYMKVPTRLPEQTILVER